MAGSVARCIRVLILLMPMSGCQQPTWPFAKAEPQPDRQGCPPGMVRAQGAAGPFCMHQYEVHAEGAWGEKDQGADFPDGSTRVSLKSAPGLPPTTGITWYQAYAACSAAGFHLCTSAEWEDACDGKPGPGGADFPTLAGTFTPGDCAIAGWREGKAYPLSPTGSFLRCVTPTGIYDLLGNAWEWVDPAQKDAQGRPRVDKRGAGHYSGDLITCDFSAVGTHAPEFEGTIGFRCCSAPGEIHAAPRE